MGFQVSFVCALMCMPLAFTEEQPTGCCVEEAQIGQALKIESSLDRFGCTFEWYRNGNLLSQNDCNIVNDETYFCEVTKNVTEVNQVGGHIFNTTCGTMSQCWIIYVKPVIHIIFSPPYYQQGIKINVTCKAKSYPLAYGEDKYKLNHPANVKVDTILTDNKDGVIYQIVNSRESDLGEYVCEVNVRELHNSKKVNLTAADTTNPTTMTTTSGTTMSTPKPTTMPPNNTDSNGDGLSTTYSFMSVVVLLYCSFISLCYQAHVTVV